METVVDFVPWVIAAAATVLTLMWKSATWVGEVNTDRVNFKEFMVEVREDIKTLLLRSTATIESESPFRLTPLGQDVSDAIGANGWAGEEAARLLEETSDLEPYQVDQFADRYVGTRLSKEWEAKVERKAYDFGLDAASVRAVLRIVLRDSILKVRSQAADSGG